MLKQLQHNHRIKRVIGFATLLVIIIFLSGGFMLVRNKLLSNADDFGLRLVESYANEEETYLQSFNLFLRYGARNLDKMIDSEADEEALKNWLSSFSNTASDVLGSSTIEPYMVYNGTLYSGNNLAIPDGYDYTIEPWYLEAIAADKNPIYTNAYVSEVTGRRIITIAIELNHTDNVLALDIQAPAVQGTRVKNNLPQGTSYFLVDSTGALLTGTSDMNLWSSSTADYIKQLLQSIHVTGDSEGIGSIRDMNNSDRTVFYATLDNGWCSIITVPNSYILQSGWDQSFVILAAASGVLIITIIILLIIDRIRGASMRTTEQTLQIIGNSFYAIFKINYVTETYQTIKTAPDKAKELGKRGTMEHFFETIHTVVEETTFQQFVKGFSADSIARIIADRVPAFGGEFKRRFPDGEHWVRVRIIADPDLNENEVIMTFREFESDMHEQMQRLELLESSLATAHEVTENQEAFFRNISHDMRTPLNGIIGMTRLAKEHISDPQEAKLYLEHVEEAAEHLRSLVNEILDMSRLRSSTNSVLEEHPFDIVNLIDRTVEFFQSEATKSGKTIFTHINSVPHWVLGDMGRLRQILNNIISNALKYSYSGARVDITLSVVDHVSVPETHALYQLIIKDTGIGMSKAFLEKLFEPFAREEAFAPRDVTGTGLGMPIVKNLVTQMGGTISVDSTLGKGSTFTITLPFQQVADDVAQQECFNTRDTDSTDSPQESTALETTTLCTSANGNKTVICADDNEMNRIIMDALLAELGYTVISATNGAEAVEAFKRSDEGAIAAILLDMQMPVLDGLEAARSIRQLNRSDALAVPIIAVTANAFPEDIARATEAGMGGYVVKPVDIDALRKALTV